MTQDYKDILLKYINGKILHEQQLSPPILNDGGQKANTVYSQLDNEFEYGWFRLGSVQCKDSQGNLNNIIAWYGGYWTDEDKQTSKGFIAMLDTELNLLQIATQYNTGTDFGKFLKLSVDTDGKIFGIDWYNDKPRFIMLNNISVKSQLTNEYMFILRQSYYLQGNVANITGGSEADIILEKNPNGANYLIAQSDPSSIIDYMTLFTINVGSANEWNDYTITLWGISGAEIETHSFAGYYVKWQDNKPILYFYDSYWGVFWDEGHTQQSNLYDIFVMTNGNINTTNLTMSYYINLNEEMFIDTVGNYLSSDNFGSSVVCLNENDYYIAQGCYTDGTDGRSFNLYPRVLHYKNGVKTLIYKPDVMESKGSDGGSYKLKLIDGTLLMTYDYPTNIIWVGEDFTQVNSVRIVMFDYAYRHNETLIGSYNHAINNPYYTIITAEFNLYKINTIIQDYNDGNIIKNIYSIYNSTNYNGDPYENTSSLVPRQVYLYDSNNKIIFARNLYNKVINNNTTEATVEIPNTMLNDITIAKQDLIGRTNYTLVENQDTLEKNIYETLYINFFITMMIQNRNNPLYVNNLPGAIRLNNSVNIGLDADVEYDDAKITKIRINYNDSTSVVKNIESSIINNRVATITFKLFTIKPVSSIEIISNDEQTTYQTISGSTLEQWKMYTITQDCYVD